jgi:tripartite-type tricarboxylate transporter receptor subunit TctC
MVQVTRRALTGGLAASGLLPLLPRARAQQGYPAGLTVKFVVPFAPGGTTDIVGRVMADRLGALWNAPTVVENVGGAGGNVGNDRVAKGPTDGSQILVMSPGIATNRFIYARLAYDPEADLVPLVRVASTPNLLSVRKGLPVSSVRELIAYAKANPGKLNFASPGVGTTVHLAGELFKKMAGVDMVHVAYRGSGPALIDLVGGSVDMLFDNISSVIPHVREGSVRALGITTLQRSPVAPEFPPIAETLPGYEVSAWWGIGVRAGTPEDICATIERDAQAVCRLADVRAHFGALAAETVGSSRAEFASFLTAEREKWGKLIAELKLRAE